MLWQVKQGNEDEGKSHTCPAQATRSNKYELHALAKEPGKYTSVENYTYPAQHNQTTVFKAHKQQLATVAGLGAWHRMDP
jgi:hypothetical protein